MNKAYKRKWFMLDLARQRSFCRDEIKVLLKVLKQCGFNGLGLYLEGFFQFPEFKTIPREGCMSVDDARWVVREAEKYGISIMPMTNLVAHAESFLSQEKFRRFASAKENQFDLNAEGFREFAKQIVDQLLACFEPEILHLGGDEVSLDEEGKKDYARFLTEIKDYLESKGVKAAIWSDLLSKEIGKTMPKDFLAFNWHYYGHREGYTEKLAENGFKNQVICPATQTWNGIVGTQHIAPWIEEETKWKCDTPISYDEVEALLQDAEKVGDYDAMICDWENYHGHLLWNGMHMVARFGQYVNGKPIDDDSLSVTLFEKKTPYMDCMHTFMNVQSLYFKECKKLPGRILTHQHEVDAMFDPLFMSKILRCGDCMSEDIIKAFEKAAAMVRNLLDLWETETDIEERCKCSLYFAVCYAEATAAILNLAHKTYKTYTQAAYSQFVNSGKYTKNLQQVEKDFFDVAQRYTDWGKTFEKAIAETGHTRQDVAKLEKVKEILLRVVQILSNFEITGSQYNKGISLPSWDKLISDIFGEIDLNK